ncbi:MAG TPA: ribosome maturation factor RimM [Dermatophilaceae bacterium]|nr:ribosome maturation factor RimM [Dermatophilaceae bacterium]
MARVGRAHGLRGEVTVALHTDDPQGRFRSGAVLGTEAAAGSLVPRALTLRSARLHGRTWLLAFEGVLDRTAAESLRGAALLAEDAAAGAPEARGASQDAGGDGDAGDAGDADAWYEEELVGLRVVDPTGAELGEVFGLELGAAQDLLVIRLVAGGSARVPFVRQLVPEVDVAGGRVVVDPPPGLLELDDGG